MLEFVGTNCFYRQYLQCLSVIIYVIHLLEAEYSILPPSPCGALCSFYTDFWTLFQWRIWLLLTIKINCSRQIFFKYPLQRYWGCRHNQGFLNSEEKNGKSISEKLLILNNFYTQNILHSVVWKLQNMLQKLGQLFSGWPQQAQQYHIGGDCLSPLIPAINVMVTFNEVQIPLSQSLSQGYPVNSSSCVLFCILAISVFFKLSQLPMWPLLHLMYWFCD